MSDLDWGFDADKPIRVRRLFAIQPGVPEYWDFRTSEEVGQLMKLDPSEVEWAIEEHGRCDTDEFVAWQPTDSNGYDWPKFDAPQATDPTMPMGPNGNTVED